MIEPTREVREIEHSTGAWLDWRREDITASRLPALFGLHPYISLDQLSDIMRGTTAAGTGSVPDSPAMRRGRILEPAVAAALAEERPELRLTKATTYHRVPEWRLGCTPDYFAEPDGLVQCKTVSPQQWQAWHGKIPTGYLIQTLCEMLVCGRAWGLLACLEVSPSYPLHIAEVPRHEAAEARILAAVAEWWAAWDRGEIPHAAPSAELAAELDDGSHRDLSADNELPAILTERAELVTHRGTAEKRIKEIDYTIKNRLGPASSAWLPGWQITFRAQERKEYTVPAASIRVLRVKAITEDDTEESAA